MQVDQATLDRFVGGEIEIQNQKKQYIYRGEVSVVTLHNDTICVDFAWLARGVGYPPLPTGWVRASQIAYIRGLMGIEISDIGDGRLCLSSLITGEIAVLFPPDGSKLDQSLIKESGTDGAS